MVLMECYSREQSQQERVHAEDAGERGASKPHILIKKQLFAQCSNIRNRKLLSQHHPRYKYATARGSQVVRSASSSPPNIEIGHKAPMTDGLMMGQLT